MRNAALRDRNDSVQRAVRRYKLWGASLAVLAVAATSQARAADYVVTDETSLRNTVAAIIAGSDPNPVIILQNDIAVSSTPFPALNKPLVINTNGNTLSGIDTVTGATPGASIVFDPPDAGGSLSILGNLAGGDSAPDAGNIAGGTGLSGDGIAFTVTNGSTVTGGAGGDQPLVTAAGQGGDGVSLVNGTLINNGTITGGTGGVSAGADAGGGAGALLNGGTDHVNNGVIRGGTGSGGGIGVGTGQRGLELSNGTLVNNGTIEGGADQGQGTSNINSDGVYLTSATLINNSTGVITGGASTTAGEVGGNGVTGQFGAVTVINHGSISGGSSAAGENTAGIIGASTFLMTVVNSGTISYGVGALGGTENDAIRFAGTTRGIVELHAGSTINGDVVARLAGTDDILRLGGDEDDDFNVSLIGATQQYQNFNIFEKTGESTWTITGQGTNQDAPWDIYEGTMLMSVGSDLGNGSVDLIGGTLAGLGTVGATAAAAGTVVSPGDPTVNNGIGTLTIDGAYTGNGGLLAIQTELGDDDSPTDLLQINGSTSGNTFVQVTNLNGGGAQTVEGIKIVNVDGVDSLGTFDLIGDYEVNGEGAVVGGAYSYQLFQGTTSVPDDGDWYLRSIGFSPTASIYEALPSVLLGIADLPTLRQRVGLRYFNEAGGSGADLPVAEETYAPVESAVYGSSIWTRIEGAHDHVEGASATDLDYDLDTWQVQAGFDGLLSDTDSGFLLGGLNFQYTNASADISADTGDGSVDVDSYGIGLTMTWYGDGGFYVDGQANAAYQLADISSDVVGDMADDVDGWSYGLSLEAGQKIGIGGDWSLTPQAQLIYTALEFDDFGDDFGSEIGLDGDSLKGRLGIALDFDSVWNAGAEKSTFYAIANVTYEFLDGPSVDISGTELGFTPDDLGGEIGIGGTYAWAGGRYALHGEALARSSFEGSYGYQGTAGFQVSW